MFDRLVQQYIARALCVSCHTLRRALKRVQVALHTAQAHAIWHLDHQARDYVALGADEPQVGEDGDAYPPGDDDIAVAAALAGQVA